jgi:hypothetical protein
VDAVNQRRGGFKKMRNLILAALIVLSIIAIMFLSGCDLSAPNLEGMNTHCKVFLQCAYLNQKNPDKSLYLSDDEIVKAQFKKSKKSIPRVKNGFEYFFNEGSIQFPNSIEKKSQCLLAAGQGISRTTTYVDNGNGIRKLSPVECERLQNVPDNYTDNVSNSQRYKMLGNGWTVDVIAYIFSQMK